MTPLTLVILGLLILGLGVAVWLNKRERKAAFPEETELLPATSDAPQTPLIPAELATLSDYIHPTPPTRLPAPGPGSSFQGFTAVNFPASTGENKTLHWPSEKSLLPGNPGSFPGVSLSSLSRVESSTRPPPLLRSASVPTRPGLEEEYEAGMRALFDEKIGVLNVMNSQVIMTTPAEVELALAISLRKIQAVLKSRNLEHAPLLVDIAGIILGRDATAAWGHILKLCLEQVCTRVARDIYMIAHYNSQANRLDKDELLDTTRRVQLRTAAAINHFQANLFETREEAVAFLQQMRKMYAI